MDRRTAILDGALAVLAEQGMRGLTHRAVDAAAGLPAGQHVVLLPQPRRPRRRMRTAAASSGISPRTSRPWTPPC